MRLRNKKTGETPEFKSLIITFKDRGKWELTLKDDLDLDDIIAVIRNVWGDYKPAEPLIKDEKVRKAVRVWADASGITKVLSYGDIFWLGFRSVNTESVWKFECFYADGSEFKLDKEYTIAELCGEEEE